MSDEPGKTPASVPVPSAASPAAPATPSAAPAPELASIQDFQKIALRVGVIVAAEPHPNADRLLVLKVDIGEPSPRQLVAGIKSGYQPADLLGKHVAVVANLKPALLRGVESQGMVLAASDGSTIILVSPERPIRPGSTIK